MSQDQACRDFEDRHNLTREQVKEMVIETKHLYGLDFLTAKRRVVAAYDTTGRPPLGIRCPEKCPNCENRK